MNPRRLGITVSLLYGSIVNGQVFEVASIKPADSARKSAIARSGNRLIFSNMSLEMLIKGLSTLGTIACWENPDGSIHPGSILRPKGRISRPPREGIS